MRTRASTLRPVPPTSPLRLRSCPARRFVPGSAVWGRVGAGAPAAFCVPSSASPARSPWRVFLIRGNRKTSPGARSGAQGAGPGGRATAGQTRLCSARVGRGVVTLVSVTIVTRAQVVTVSATAPEAACSRSHHRPLVPGRDRLLTLAQRGSLCHTGPGLRGSFQVFGVPLVHSRCGGAITTVQLQNLPSSQTETVLM